MVGEPMPTGPSALKDALSRATSMIDSGDVDNALELLRTEAWAAAENNSQKVQVISLAAEAKIAKGDIDMGNRKMHWQDAHNSYQRALKLEPSNKDIRRAQNKLASMMDEQSISLGKGLQLFDDGNPTPAGLAAVFVGIMVFLVAFKFAGESLEQPLESTEVTLQVSYIHPDDPNSRVEGEIVIQLYASEAPKHVENFLYLVDNGMYDSTIFHRIIDGFMIQGGDIDDMNGAGGYAGIWSGYCNGQISGSDGEIYTSENCPRNDWTVPDEADNGLLHEPSVIAMAKTSAPNTAGSQFYIVPSDSTPSHLDGVHTVFGMVTSGMNHVDAISEVSTGSNDKPVEDVRLIQAFRN
ncbi:MAG: peptidylprolyl isomerase [Candidatus Thalassarchaeum sp.]|nr:peptidylprolyl isomerase [Candidatus Thalassarchaeum sp.]